MRSCKKYLLLLGLLLMAAVGGCGGIGYEETDENKPVTIKGPEGLPTNPKNTDCLFFTYWEYRTGRLADTGCGRGDSCLPFRLRCLIRRIKVNAVK